jgi:membrane-bound lytic murein transglycosylase B
VAVLFAVTVVAGASAGMAAAALGAAAAAPTAAALGAAGAPTAAALGAAPTTTTSSSIPAVEVDTVDAQFVTAARAEAGSAQRAYELALGGQAAANAAATAAAGRFDAAAGRVAGLESGERFLAARIQATHDRLRDFAVGAYVSGGPGSPVSAMLGAASIGDFARRRAIFTSVAKESAADLQAYVAARADAQRGTRSLFDTREAARAVKTAADLAALLAANRVKDAGALVSDRRELLLVATDAIAAAGTDIPSMMLDAYERAALSVQTKGCRIAWWGIAGVGKVESDHGRSHGASLQQDGRLVPPILGPALDGTNGTQATPATDGGKLTGDTRWDHAVGPMQFVPATWREYASDGNGDGHADPNNIYDAALGAARYLCAASGDLDTPAGLRAAYHAYNHSDEYVAEVLSVAASYQAADAAGAIPAMSSVPLYRVAPR